MDLVFSRERALNDYGRRSGFVNVDGVAPKPLAWRVLFQKQIKRASVRARTLLRSTAETRKYGKVAILDDLDDEPACVAMEKRLMVPSYNPPKDVMAAAGEWASRLFRLRAKTGLASSSATERGPKLTDLPEELLLQILGHLALRERVRAGLVNRQFARLAWEKTLVSSLNVCKYNCRRCGPVGHLLATAGPSLRHLCIVSPLGKPARCAEQSLWAHDEANIPDTITRLDFLYLQSQALPMAKLHALLVNNKGLEGIWLDEQAASAASYEVMASELPRLNTLCIVPPRNRRVGMSARQLCTLLETAPDLADIFVVDVSGFDDLATARRFAVGASRLTRLQIGVSDVDNDQLASMLTGRIDPLNEDDVDDVDEPRSRPRPLPLTLLHLIYTGSVTNRGLRCIAPYLANLEYLYLRNVRRNMANGVLAILDHAHGLKGLDLSLPGVEVHERRRLFGEGFVLALAEKPCTQTLVEVTIFGCGGTESEAAVRLLAACPRIEKLELDSGLLGDDLLARATVLLSKRNEQYRHGRPAAPLHIGLVDSQTVTWRGLYHGMMFNESVVRSIRAGHGLFLQVAAPHKYAVSYEEHLASLQRGDINRAACIAAQFRERNERSKGKWCAPSTGHWRRRIREAKNRISAVNSMQSDVS